MKCLFFVLCFGMAANCFSLSKSDLKEIAHASEAASPHITDDATFLKFKNDRLVTIKAGKNNFTCFVVRDPRGRFEPSCLNEQAVRSILPAYELQMKLLYKGQTAEETHAALGKAFKDGELPASETGALVYMMSPNNKIYFKGKLVPTPVHQMYYYPKLDDKVFSLASGPVFLWQEEFPHLSALIVAVPGLEPSSK